MILDQFNLQGKVALVTGSGRGIGQGLALGLAEAGCDIAGIYSMTSGDTGEQVEALGRQYFEYKADLTDPSCAQGVVDAVIERYGKIDILVNNAGIIRRAPALEFTEADWDDVLNINLKSVFFLSQAVAKTMVAREIKGKIINICSMLSYQGGILVASYTSSKSGVMGLTRELANEWAPYGICVNGIAPGYISTDNTAALRANEVRNKQILERIPHGRWGTPEDLQGACVFLASPASDYVIGYTIAVDGGWLSR